MSRLRSLRHVAVASAIIALAAACGCDAPPAEPRIDRCDRSLWALEWDVDGLPPPGSSPEWREPPTVERPEGTATRTNLEYPWDMRDRQAYYLRRGDEGFRMRLNAVVGTGWPDAAAELVDIYVNAERVGSVVDGVEVPGRVTIPIVDGLGSVELLVPYETFRPGMNHVHVITTVDLGPRDDPDRVRFLFAGGTIRTVSRDAPEPATEWTDSPGWRAGGLARAGYATEVTYISSATGGEEPLNNRRPQIEGSTFRGMLNIQRHPAVLTCDPPLDDTVAIVALLDGQPITIAGHDRIIATLAEGERRIFDFEIELPTSSGRHHLAIHELPGLGRAQRLKERERVLPPWSTLIHPVVDASWEVP